MSVWIYSAGDGRNVLRRCRLGRGPAEAPLACCGEQCFALRVRQTQCSSERLDGVRIWFAPMPTLERTHARSGQAGALGELFLRERRSGAQPSKLIAECGRCAVGDTSHASVYAAGAPDKRHAVLDCRSDVDGIYQPRPVSGRGRGGAGRHRICRRGCRAGPVSYPGPILPSAARARRPPAPGSACCRAPSAGPGFLCGLAIADGFIRTEKALCAVSVRPPR